jgi:general transcription factor 3C polypeptide 5 (transcription factor C subunit 1)
VLRLLRSSFKANPNSRVVTIVDEATGAEKKRYVNKDRWKGYGPVTAMYSDSGVGLGQPMQGCIGGIDAA